MSFLDRINALKRESRFAAIGESIPYAACVGLEIVESDDGIVTVLRRRESNVGNTQIPAIHGGVVGGLLEHAATMELLWSLDLEAMPRVINISIDYLRPSALADTHARGIIIRQGRRIANVRVQAWQADPDRPVAAAHAHFLLS